MDEGRSRAVLLRLLSALASAKSVGVGCAASCDAHHSERRWQLEQRWWTQGPCCWALGRRHHGLCHGNRRLARHCKGPPNSWHRRRAAGETNEEKKRSQSGIRFGDERDSATHTHTHTHTCMCVCACVCVFVCVQCCVCVQCVCMYISHTHINTHTHTYTSTNAGMYRIILMCAHTSYHIGHCICMCAYKNTDVCVRESERVCVDGCMYVCMHACMHACMCTHACEWVRE